MTEKKLRNPMNEKKLSKFESLADQLSPEAFDDVLKFSRYLIETQKRKWLTPLDEINVILESLTPANIVKVRNFMRDVHHKQLRIEGFFDKRKKPTKKRSLT